MLADALIKATKLNKIKYQHSPGTYWNAPKLQHNENANIILKSYKHFLQS